MYKIFLNLGYQPFANDFSKNPKKIIKPNKLQIGFNTKNYLVSIAKKFPSKKIYNNKYPYLSSASKTMRESFRKLASKIKNKYNPKKILEIGSNDGSFIKHFKKKKALCVEPCKNIALITKKKGYLTFDKLWDLNLVNKLKKKIGQVDCIYSANTISHINNLNIAFNAIKKILSNDGILIIEDPSLLENLKKNAYDQFYNEHIYVFSLIALNKLLQKFNLEVFDIDILTTHGGSLRYYIKNKNNKKFLTTKKVSSYKKKEIKYGLNKIITYKKFAERVHKSKKKLFNIFDKIKKDKKIVIGYGATAKSTTVLNFCSIDSNFIDYFLDTTSYKINKYTPGTNIKIKKYKNKLSAKDCSYAYLGAWNFKDEILKKERQFLRQGGKFITHVPTPRIISK
jgi:methylation protein EvaC